MSQARVRIFYGTDENQQPSVLNSASAEANRVTVKLGDIFPILAEAVKSKRNWIHDFEDDEVAVSADLYEVILAYQHQQRKTA